MKTISYFWLTVVLTVLVTGCAEQPKKQLFYWGDYERLVYAMYIEPGSADPDTQIDTLTTDLQQAQSEGLAIAPGVHAHLGYMYALKGDLASAKSHFLKEKQLYPESTIFIDGVIKKLEQGGQS